MVEKHGLPAGLKAFQPNHRLARDQGRGHAHVRAAVAADEAPALAVEFKMLVAERLFVRVAATLGPFGVVVARHHIVGIFQPVEQGLNVAQFGIGPKIGNIPAHHHEINVGQGVDIVDASNQVRPGFRTHRIVVVRDKGDADRFSALLIPQRFERMFRIAGPVI